MLENNREKLLIMIFISKTLMYRQLIHLGMDKHKGKDHTLLILQRRGSQKDLKRVNRGLVVKAF